MAPLPDEIRQLRTLFMRELKEASTSKEVEGLKVKYLGKKGPVQALMQELKQCPLHERPHFGKLVNDLKEELFSHCDHSLLRIKGEEMERRLIEERLDVTLPGRRAFLGRIHPLQQMMERELE